MPKPLKKPARKATKQAVKRSATLDDSALPAPIRKAIAQIGARGGKVSGAKRMEMPEEERKAIARKAAAARWAKKPNP